METSANFVVMLEGEENGFEMKDQRLKSGYKRYPRKCLPLQDSKDRNP